MIPVLIYRLFCSYIRFGTLAMLAGLVPVGTSVPK
jgi:hypothetical protein